MAKSALIEALNDKDAYVREYTAKALAEYGPAVRRGIPDLIGRLLDDDAEVRIAASNAIRRIEPDSRAIANLSRNISAGFKSDDDNFCVNIAAINCLLAIRPEGRQVVLETFGEKEAITYRYDPSLLDILSELPNLKNLRITSSGLTNDHLRMVGRLTNLRALDLDSEEISDDGVAHLVGLMQLEELVLKKTTVSDDAIRQLSKLGHIKVLHLGEGVTDNGMKDIAQFKELRELSLEHTRVTDAGLPYLNSIKTLERLVINSTITQRVAFNTRMTEKGIAQLKAQLPKLEVVDSAN